MTLSNLRRLGSPSQSQRNKSWVWGAAVIVLLGAVCLTCRSKHEGNEIASARPALPSPPKSLLLELVIPAPQQSWEQLRTGLGPRGKLLPSRYPVLLSSQLGASPVLSGRFLPELPVVGAVSAIGQALEWVIGFPVQSGAELVAELTTGNNAPFRALPVPHLVLLERSGPRSFAVANNRLLVGSSRAALENLGAFVARKDAHEQTTQAAAHLRLAQGVGPVLREWAALQSGQWSQQIRQSLQVQRRTLPGEPLGDPEALLEKLEQQRATALELLGRVTGGQLALSVDAAQLGSAALGLTFDLQIQNPPQLKSIACDALPLVPRQTQGYVLFDPGVLGNAEAPANPREPSWTSVFLPKGSSKTQVEEWSKRMGPLSGPLMLGAGGDAAFLSLGWDADLSALEGWLTSALTLPLVTHNLPSLFGQGRDLRIARDRGMLTAGSASPKGPPLFAAGLSGGRVWFVSAAEPVEWLKSVLSAGPQKPGLEQVREGTCHRDLLLAAGIVTENGEGRLQLSQTPTGITLSAEVPWVDVLSNARAALGVLE